MTTFWWSPSKKSETTHPVPTLMAQWVFIYFGTAMAEAEGVLTGKADWQCIILGGILGG